MQLQTLRPDVSTFPNADQNLQDQTESRLVLDKHRVEKAEQDLVHIAKRLRQARSEYTEDSYLSTALEDIWRVFSRLIHPDQQHSNDQAPVSFLSNLPVYQLRKLAPFAPFVANIIAEYMSTVQNERKSLIKAAYLSQWCLISSVLFGTPPVPAGVAASMENSFDSAPRDRSTQSFAPHSVQEIPQSRWPTKSTKSRTTVQSKSKAAQMFEIESCQNVCFTLLSAINIDPSVAGNGRPEGSLIPAITNIIEECLAALDSNIQALIAQQNNTDKSRHLLQLAIQERTTKPTLEFLARWIEAVPRVEGDSVVTAVSGDVATVPRILYRESLRDTAANLRQRLKRDVVADHEINEILGSCLLTNPENLTSRLHRLAKHKNKDELLFLWRSCSSIMKAQSDNETRTNLISLFLTASLANLPDGKSQYDELQAVLAEIHSILPKPTPLPVYHSLLSLYAGINTTSSLDHQETGNSVLSSQASLQNLLATWSRMKAEKVTPDIKAYTILITGLGKKGDYHGLQRVWEELVNDAACKALWQKEEGTGK